MSYNLINFILVNRESEDGRGREWGEDTSKKVKKKKGKKGREQERKA